MKKQLLSLILLLVVAVSGALPAGVAWEPPEGAANAQAVYLYNLDTDTLVYEKNARERRAVASLTKLMTGLLLVESGEDLSTPYTIPEELGPEFSYIIAANGTRAYLQTGETVTLEDLLYGSLLPSGNDASSTIAYYLGDGDMDAFVDQMNQRAVQLGCEDTHFSCPHGLEGIADGNYSTAYDIFLIAKACWENETLMKVMSSTEYWMPLTEKHTQPSSGAPEGRSYRLRSTVSMQDPDSPLYRDYVRGMKTGFTDEAGRCLVTSAEYNGTHWLLVVLGAPDGLTPDGVTYAVQTTADLYDWALPNFKPVAAVNTETPVLTLPLKWCAESETVGAYAKEPVTLLAGPGGEDSLEKTAAVLSPQVEAPVQAGQVLGTLTVTGEGGQTQQVELVAIADYERSNWLYLVDCVRPYAWVMLPVGAAVVIIAVLAARGSQKRRKTRR